MLRVTDEVSSSAPRRFKRRRPASSTAAQPRSCKGAALVIVVVVYDASSVIAVNGSKPEFSRYEDHSECQITRRQPRQRAVSTFLRCCSTVDKLVKCFSAVIRDAESLQQTENHRECFIYIYGTYKLFSFLEMTVERILCSTFLALFNASSRDESIRIKLTDSGRVSCRRVSCC